MKYPNRIAAASLALAACLAFFASPGNADAADGPLRVAATLSDLGCAARAVGGDDVEVTVLCPGGMDPHYLPAKPSLSRMLGRADALLFNGLELEIGWLPPLLEKARNPRVRAGAPGMIDCSAALDAVLDVPSGAVDRGLGDIHPQGNPHYTIDPRRMIAVVQLVGRRFGELDPPHAAAYRDRAEAYAALLRDRLPVWRERTAALRDRHVLLNHQHWNYLCDWLGLDVIGEIEHRPGIAASPRHVQDMVEKSRTLGDVVIVAAGWDHLDVVREIAGRAGASLAVLPGHSGAEAGVDDYVAFLDEVTRRLAEAAAAPGGGRP